MTDEDRSVLTRPAPPPDEVRGDGSNDETVIDQWFADRGGDRPLTVLVHGGFWRPAHDRTHLRPMAAAIRAAGWDVAAVEYRRHPGRPDRTVGDVQAAVGRLADRPLITVGHSAGGHLVLWLASSAPPPNLRATIALAPVADLGLAHEQGLGDGAVAAFLGAALGERADLDPVRLPSPSTPVSLVHGTDDAIVPLALAESYAAHHPATRLVTAPGAGHFALIDPRSAAWPTVLAELARAGASS